MAGREELTYTLPPDILHYEVKYFLGFGIQELLLASVAGIALMMFSPLAGLVVGVVVLISLRRYEGLGNRSLPAYGLAILGRRLRTVAVVIPRTFPREEGRVVVADWEGEELYVVEAR